MEYKHIPVTEERYRELYEHKRAGETWDDTLGRLIEERGQRGVVDA